MPHRKKTKRKRPICKFPRKTNGEFKKWTKSVKRKNRNCRKRKLTKKHVRRHLKAKRRVSRPIVKTYSRGSCRSAAQTQVNTIRKKKYASIAAVKRDVTRKFGRNSKFAMKSKGEVKKKSRRKSKSSPKYGPLRGGYRFPRVMKAGPFRSGYRFGGSSASKMSARGMPALVPVVEDYSDMPSLTPIIPSISTGSIIQSGLTPQQLRAQVMMPPGVPMGTVIGPSSQQRLRAEALRKERARERRDRSLGEQLADFLSGFSSTGGGPGDEPLYVSPFKPKGPRRSLRINPPVLESTTEATSTY